MHGRNLSELVIGSTHPIVGDSKLFQLMYIGPHGSSMGMMGWTHESQKYVIAKHNYV